MITDRKYFHVSGSLRANEPSYIYRKADKELIQTLQNGNFCFVLTDRQMGKSSLKVMAISRLRKKGWECVDVDSSFLGSTGGTAEQWYNGFMNIIATELELEQEFQHWWKDQKEFTPVFRMHKFWEKFVLPNVEKPIAIFIDEIDQLLRLDKDSFGTDDFFASLRATYNKRSVDDNYRRLHFCILGVATPSDLIEDASNTPFNIGKPIRLENFSFQEAGPLTKGLGFMDNPEEVLKEILYWTGGQPYLTQKICLELSRGEFPEEKNASEWIGQVLDEQFFFPQYRNQDPKVSDIEKRILEDERWTFRMLKVYKKILREGSVPTDRRKPEQIYLKLSGLVREQGNTLTVYNPIYKQVFDVEWIKKSQKRLNRPYTQYVSGWLESGKSPDTLLKGVVLKDALEWKANREDLSKDEEEFLNVSLMEEVRSKEKAKRIVYLWIAFFITLGAAVFGFYSASMEKKAKIEANILRKKDSSNVVKLEGQRNKIIEAESLTRQQLISLWEEKESRLGLELTQHGKNLDIYRRAHLPSFEEEENDKKTRTLNAMKTYALRLIL